jgi:hypothetical protein
MATYQINTSGPCLTKTGTLAQVKRYVEDHAPLRRGWTGKWKTVRQGSRQLHYYVRANSRGRILGNYGVVVYKINN